MESQPLQSTEITGNSGTILIADDDKNILFAFRKAFDGRKWQVLAVSSGEEALHTILEQTPDIVFLDIKMPEMSGLEVLKQMKEEGLSIPVIVITGYGTMQTAIDAIQLGAYEYITKPLDVERVRTVARRALEVSRLKSEVTELRERVAREASPYELIGESPVMQDLYKQIGTIAATPNEATVLITGESGTGKELVARNIHENGPHPEAPFQAINCTVLPETLLESELFGHEKGAFTGANERKTGKFELAGKGTIFLDEIGDIPPNFQKKLLRVIQEREFERVGGTESIPVRARFIAATHHNLARKTEAGEFREDLYYRLNVLHVTVPSLREHMEDLALLCEHFLTLAGAKFDKRVQKVSDELLEMLRRHNFPGNVRELEHLIERGVAMMNGEIVRPDNLPPDLLENLATGEEFLDVPVVSKDLREAREAVVRNFEKAFVRARLRETGGNVSEAARISGVERQSFQRLMRKHDINSEDFRS